MRGVGVVVVSCTRRHGQTTQGAGARLIYLCIEYLAQAVLPQCTGAFPCWLSRVTRVQLQVVRSLCDVWMAAVPPSTLVPGTSSWDMPVELDFLH